MSERKEGLEKKTSREGYRKSVSLPDAVGCHVKTTVYIDKDGYEEKRTKVVLIPEGPVPKKKYFAVFNERGVMLRTNTTRRKRKSNDPKIQNLMKIREELFDAYIRSWTDIREG